MRIKVLRAATMPEAMARLRQELGPDAALLSTRPVPGGVEVTGGLEPAEAEEGDLLLIAPGGALVPRRFHFAASPTESAAALPRNGGAHGHSCNPEGRIHPRGEDATIHPRGEDARFHLRGEDARFHLRGEDARLHLRGEDARLHLRGEDAATLDFHRVPASLAARLAAAPLEASLEASLRFVRLPDGVARPLLLAGPPGAGKTLTCAKLAARRVLAGESPPLVVTADAERPAAAEQLAAFTRVLGATLAVAPTPAAAAAALARRAPGQPVLIDTAGMDPFMPEQARSLAALIAATGAAIVLVLPASMDAAEAADLARAFAALGARHLLPTRLDATRRIGAVLAAAAGGGLALCEAGTSPQVADGLTCLEPVWLSARLRRRSHLAPPSQEGNVP